VSALLAQPAAPMHCPTVLFGQSVSPSKEERLSELRRLEQFSNLCLTRADYYAYRGALLVSLGRGLEAVSALERALLLEPNAPGVQLDYAQALALSGDRQSAAMLMEQLIARQDIHPQFRDYLLAERDKLMTLRWVTRLRASAQLGYETNLNSAPAERFFTLTPASGDVVLELGESSQRKEGFAVLSMASLSSATDLGAGQGLQAFLGLRARASPSQTHYQQAEASLAWRGAELGGSKDFLRGLHPSARIGLGHLQFNGASVFWAPRVELGAEASLPGACLGRSAFVGEFRRFPQAELQDGNYRGILVSANCYFGAHFVSTQLAFGVDGASNEARPGGDQDRWEANLAWSRELGRVGITLAGSIARVKDHDGYSALLARGATRSLERRFIRAELSGSISGGLEWFWSAEASEQRSNLALFKLSSEAIYAGLRARID